MYAINVCFALLKRLLVTIFIFSKKSWIGLAVYGLFQENLLRSTEVFFSYAQNICTARSLFCLCWGLTSQSTIFQSCQYFRGVKCLAQGHNTAAVGFEPRPLAPESDTLPLSHCAPPLHDHIGVQVKLFKVGDLRWCVFDVEVVRCKLYVPPRLCFNYPGAAQVLTIVMIVAKTHMRINGPVWCCEMT